MYLCLLPNRAMTIPNRNADMEHLELDWSVVMKKFADDSFAFVNDSLANI